MAAIAITTSQHGPLTIPLASVNILKRSPDGKAVIVFHNGSEMQAREDYKHVSDRMVSVNVSGSVTTEPA